MQSSSPDRTREKVLIFERIKYRLATGFIFLAIALFFAPILVHAADFEEGRYEVIDTSLEQTLVYGNQFLGYWLDNATLVMNALQDVPDAQAKHLDRVVLFNIKTRKISTLLPNSRLVCRNSKSQIARIITYDSIDEFVRIDSQGAVSATPETPTWREHICREREPLKPERLQYFLNEGEGYIDLGKTGGGYSREKAVFYRLGLPPVELPVLGGDVNNMFYIEHLQQYLISSTDFLSGSVQPAGKPVFNLMTKDGKITEIEQPREFVKKFGRFGDVVFTREGILLGHFDQRGNKNGRFLLRGEKIIRVFGVTNEFAGKMVPSPDGCSVAFLAFKDARYETRKTVKIINLCEEK